MFPSWSFITLHAKLEGSLNLANCNHVTKNWHLGFCQNIELSHPMPKNVALKFALLLNTPRLQNCLFSDPSLTVKKHFLTLKVIQSQINPPTLLSGTGLLLSSSIDEDRFGLLAGTGDCLGELRGDWRTWGGVLEEGGRWYGGGGPSLPDPRDGATSTCWGWNHLLSFVSDNRAM